MDYPKHVYRPAKNDKGFDTILVNSKAEHDLIRAEVFDSPAQFDIETAPGPASAKPEFLCVDDIAISTKKKRRSEA